MRMVAQEERRAIEDLLLERNGSLVGTPESHYTVVTDPRYLVSIRGN